MRIDVFLTRFTGQLSTLYTESGFVESHIPGQYVIGIRKVVRSDISHRNVAYFRVDENGHMVTVSPSHDALVSDWQAVQRALA